MFSPQSKYEKNESKTHRNNGEKIWGNKNKMLYLISFVIK